MSNNGVINHCAYCHKEMERRIFCKPSHKTMFYRKGKPNYIPPIMSNPDKVFLDLAKANLELKEKEKKYCKSCGEIKTLHGTKYIKCTEFKNII